MSYTGKSGVVNDLVLLDNANEAAILKALRDRYSSNEIYTYIGNVLISCNPYKNIPGLYGNGVMKKYVGKKIYQNNPHTYAVAEGAYRAMQLKTSKECIVITGESGSGKTEASKQVMSYLGFLSSKSKQVQKIKEQLLETNPLLEAFGNAKTRRNDNSSRFGKYFSILFLYSDPAGGKIEQFLLEKSRVVSQQQGERNFHVFYQILTDGSLRSNLNLSRNHSDYNYFTDPKSASVKSIDDSRDYNEMSRAMDWVGLSPQDQSAIFGILGGILHLGNVDFVSAGHDKSNVSNIQALSNAADLFGVSEQDLSIALTHRTVKSGIESVRTGLSVEKAKFARDSLAKSLYGKLFEFIVKRANETIHCDQFSTSIGILDIYGFEILGVNGFEQLCINHTNERLHQLFIELTLKGEQAEYQKEGIAWTKVNYYNNLPLCQLIERRGGIYSLIDEESIFPNGNDQSLMKKLANNIRDREFQSSRSDAGHFQIKHYAGEVTYDTDGMLEANKDTLFADLVLVSNSSQNPVMGTFFVDHPAAQTGRKTNKRPPTTCMQYKKQVNDLMETLRGCNQHYIRCIKPNDLKRSGVFQDDLSMEQVKYLGLMENVKVRRAGYSFRMTYLEFMSKYKVTIKGHPEFEPNAKKGTEKILKSAGVSSKEYEMGKTKVFIKNAKTILAIEDERKRFLEESAKFVPEDDGLIHADRCLSFNSKYVRQEHIFIVGAKGFYWFSKEGSLEHFISLEKAELIGYSDSEGWMTIHTSYPGKLEEDPKVQVTYVSDNIYGDEILNFVEVLKNVGADIDVSKMSSVPADARDATLYKQNLKMIGKGGLGMPAVTNGPSSNACCIIS